MNLLHFKITTFRVRLTTFLGRAWVYVPSSFGVGKTSIRLHVLDSPQYYVI